MSRRDQIAELRRKIQLLEANNRAENERSENRIRQNSESINQLRENNRTLYRQLAEARAGDESVIKAAFKNRGPEKEAYRNMSVKGAKIALEKKVLIKRKLLNALKHTTQTIQQNLEEIKMECQRMKPEGSSRAQSVDAHARKRTDEFMKLRMLENSLEKTRFKCKEAENIMSHYLQLKSHLQEESLTFPSQLERLEAEILKHRQELYVLQALNDGAQLSKEAAKAELQQQEELLSKERKERERIIVGYRRKVEELQAQAERVDRKTQRPALQPDEMSSEAQCSNTRMAGEEEKPGSTIEEAFHRLKEATGVTNIQEIVDHFISQKERSQHLEKLKGDNEMILQRLKKQKELLNRELQDTKYSGEAQLSSDQQTLEKRRQQLQALHQRCAESKKRLDWHLNTFSTVRAGVEHLANKLQHITLSEHTGTRASPDSDEYVWQLMTQCELKLQLLQEELEGKDLAALMKEMEKDEFHLTLEANLPACNIRVKLPSDKGQDLFSDEDKSEEDEADFISREALKRQSKLLSDSNSKKKAWKKKKADF